MKKEIIYNSFPFILATGCGAQLLQLVSSQKKLLPLRLSPQIPLLLKLPPLIRMSRPHPLQAPLMNQDLCFNITDKVRDILCPVL